MKNKKIIIIIFIVLLVLAALFLLKKSDKLEEVIKQENNIVSLDDSFYNTNNLVQNKYISLIENKEDKLFSSNEENNPVIIKIENNKVYVPENLDNIEKYKEVTLSETPKVVKYLSYKEEDTAYFIILTEEKNVYLAQSKQENGINVVSEFKKVNIEEVNNLYSYYVDENITYPYKPLTIYADVNNLLKRVSPNGLTINYKEDNQFTDQICAGWSDEDSCIGLYITSDKYLYLIKDKEKKLYQEIRYKNKQIKVKDAFSVTKIKTDDEISKLKEVSYYIIGEDSYLYEITQNENYEITTIKQYNKSKVSNYSYDVGNDKVSFRATINYEKSDKSVFKNVSVVSSLYYRYNK